MIDGKERAPKEAAHDPGPPFSEANLLQPALLAAALLEKITAQAKKAGGKGASLQRHPRQVFIQAFFSRMNMPVLVSSSTLSEGFLVTRLTRIIAATDRMKPYMLGCMGREMTLVNWA